MPHNRHGGWGSVRETGGFSIGITTAESLLQSPVNPFTGEVDGGVYSLNPNVNVRAGDASFQTTASLHGTVGRGGSSSNFANTFEGFDTVPRDYGAHDRVQPSSRDGGWEVPIPYGHLGGIGRVHEDRFGINSAQPGQSGETLDAISARNTNPDTGLAERPFDQYEYQQILHRTPFQVDQAARDAKIGLFSDLGLEEQARANMIMPYEFITANPEAKAFIDKHFPNLDPNQPGGGIDRQMYQWQNDPLSHNANRNNSSSVMLTGVSINQAHQLGSSNFGNELATHLSNSSNDYYSNHTAGDLYTAIDGRTGGLFAGDWTDEGSQNYQSQLDSDVQNVFNQYRPTQNPAQNAMNQRRSNIKAHRRDKFRAVVNEHSRDRLRRTGMGTNTALTQTRAPKNATTGTTLLRNDNA